jgi:PAS domain S-box-containing protein
VSKQRHFLKRIAQDKPHWLIVGIYFVVASLWIFFSDNLLFVLGLSSEQTTNVNIMKGMGFVLMTSAMLYFLLRRAFRDRIELEAQLIAQMHELRIRENAIENAITGFALADLEGKLTYVNEAFLDLWGYSDDAQVLGRSVLEFWKDPQIAQDVVVAISQKDTFVGAMTAKRYDHTLSEIELRASMVRDETGQPIRMVASFIDVTEQRHAEATKLENERLTARFKKEQERNEFIMRIVSMLSHDLRNSLSVISSSSQMLLHYNEKITPERHNAKLQGIERQVQYALELLEETVNMARGNLVDAPFNPAPVNIETLCEISVDEIQSAHHATNRITFMPKISLMMVRLDEVLVSRILLNLLSNALKYSGKDDAIRLELDEAQGETGEWLLLRVVDAGQGIAEEDLSKIFEAFYRGEDVAHVRGTGLGLSIVQDCVNRHQGRIEVTSVLGEGSTFTVYLPLERVEVHHMVG